ncbi:helix-turn-helix domain-containing protein [Peribacillus sp. NPDC056705]|uniref:helix-turn-helix domain-containing protein n=1 Tax=Peribacillus sp. NPDC056705 TaxID=3345918 RepID=UPI003748483A
MLSSETVQRVIDYMEEHLAEPLTLAQIADVAVMSVPNLYRWFHSMTGHPIKEYIRKRRISEAAVSLRQTALPTIDIGFMHGFDSYPAFISTFKRLTGLTPGAYRKSEIVYSFERLNLAQRVTYLEEREITERFPEVKVIRLGPHQGWGYLHVAEQEQGLERAAIDHFQSLLAPQGVELSELKLYGWHVDLDEGDKPFGYQLMAMDSRKTGWEPAHPSIVPIEWSGGLYAVTRVQAVTEVCITSTWNVLFSEWLPRSVFDMNGVRFIEEYVLQKEQIARMKLYLPVKRSKSLQQIKVVELPSVQVVSFRAAGVNAVEEADEASIAWISRHGFVNASDLQVYMSCDDGLCEDHTVYEVMITPPADYHPASDEQVMERELGGGIYACLTTGTYGSMIGVLEAMYRWLDTSATYEPDADRSWFASYTPEEDVVSAAEQELKVICYVPVKKIRSR